MLNTSEERQKEREKTIVNGMLATLDGDVSAINVLAETEEITKFHRYKEVRHIYKQIQQLIEQLLARVREKPDLVPEGTENVVMKQKIAALKSFTALCVYFFRNAPPTVTRAIGARELLIDEQRNFTNAHEYFDMMLFEAGIDDKTADALEETRTQIEEIMGLVATLLEKSPASLEEF
ncbi:hypothetical protein [Radicibacter daui]|jgi:hypothetical protein|uniref:hypothetical protein n=1 Tax=Radicibacter daui TaxID=3064829 RepID=UPI004046FA30